MTKQKLILTGDINLVNVVAGDQPFVNVRQELREADLVFSNLECSLYKPTQGQAAEQEGFFADPEVGGAALIDAGIGAVGIANNVNFGEAPIVASVGHLDRLGIPHTGAGADRAAARAPIIVVRNGVRYGFLQRCSVYWGTDHEATEKSAGIATSMAHTAYQVPMYRDRRGWIPFNRPGIPPTILTWCDPNALQTFADEIAALRPHVDVLVASCHWGLGGEVLDYMIEMAHTAINAGADLVMGHGPHNTLPVGFHKGKPIFYGLGSFCFHTGHEGIKHGDWVGLMVESEVDRGRLTSTRFSFVRHSEANETVICKVGDEDKVLAHLTQTSVPFGAKLEVRDGLIIVSPTAEPEAAQANSVLALNPAFTRRVLKSSIDRGNTPR